MIETMKGDRNEIYVTASVDRQGAIRQGMFEWLLAIPAIAPLLVAAALHLALYLYLAAIEKETSNSS